IRARRLGELTIEPSAYSGRPAPVWLAMVVMTSLLHLDAPSFGRDRRRSAGFGSQSSRDAGRLDRALCQMWGRRCASALRLGGFDHQRRVPAETLESHPQAQRQLPDEARDQLEARQDGILLVDTDDLADHG